MLKKFSPELRDRAVRMVYDVRLSRAVFARTRSESWVL